MPLTYTPTGRKEHHFYYLILFLLSRLNFNDRVETAHSKIIHYYKEVSMDLWVFDNDGTLYDDRIAHAEFMQHLAVYLRERLGIPEADTEIFARQLRVKHKTSSTVLAIVREFHIAIEGIIEQTYQRVDLDACRVPQEDRERDEALERIKEPKVILTNNPSKFARRILERSGLSRHFIDVVGMEETDFVLKPDPQSFLAVVRRHPDATRIFFCDDSRENLDAAAVLGWKTIWYLPKNGGENPGVSHTRLHSFRFLPDVRETLLGEV